MIIYQANLLYLCCEAVQAVDLHAEASEGEQQVGVREELFYLRAEEVELG